MLNLDVVAKRVELVVGLLEALLRLVAVATLVAWQSNTAHLRSRSACETFNDSQVVLEAKLVYVYDETVPSTCVAPVMRYASDNGSSPAPVARPATASAPLDSSSSLFKPMPRPTPTATLMVTSRRSRPASAPVVRHHAFLRLLLKLPRVRERSKSPPCPPLVLAYSSSCSFVASSE